MAAPEYVPVKPMDDVRAYESPPRRPDSWRADRPGDLQRRQPRGPIFGDPGPDQGYALVLAKHFEGRLSLVEGEREEDAIDGCLGVTLKRASIFGRAPVIHDWKIALTVWGFLAPQPANDLVEVRKRMFAEVGLPEHYVQQRRIVAVVPESTLRKSPEKVAVDHAADWKALLDLDAVE